MKLRYVSALAAACVATVLLGEPGMSEAKSCDDASSECWVGRPTIEKSTSSTGYAWNKQTRKWVPKPGYARRNVGHVRHGVASRASKVLPAARQQVVSLIKQMAPSYGVPTWFALRIAKVESGFNPRARGLAGEYGVFQLKCSTARGIGFRGGCSGLLNAGTNIRYGLKHLQLAVRGSRGNLKLAASKHNGGLGRRSLVRAYVRRVF
jgi:soluble lytic murein transglycosylase-like protein